MREQVCWVCWGMHGMRVGIPYNKDLISLEEIGKMGEKIRKIDENVQVCVLDYRPQRFEDHTYRDRNMKK